MRPVLFEIPALPAGGWMLLLAVFLGVSMVLAARDIPEGVASPEERRRRLLGAILTNAAVFLIGALLLWRFREQVAQPLPVRAYGMMLMVAFALGLLILQRLARGTRLTADMAVDLVLGILISALLASRLLFVFLHWSAYAANPREWLMVWEGGLSFHGGAAGAALWVAWFTHRHRIGFFWLADLLVPAVAVGYAVARVGCFLNGCCYGTPTDVPWAVRFQDPPLSGHWTVPSHPVQLYASVANLAIFAALLAFTRRKQGDGQVFGLWMVLYSIYRFAAETLRSGVTGELFALGMTQAQWASLAIAAVGAVLMVWRQGKFPKQPTAEVVNPGTPAPGASRHGGSKRRSGSGKKRR